MLGYDSGPSPDLVSRMLEEALEGEGSSDKSVLGTKSRSKYVLSCIIAQVKVQWGIIFFTSAKYFHQSKASEILCGSKISFPNCRTSVTYIYSQPIPTQRSLIVFCTLTLFEAFYNQRTIRENTEHLGDAGVFKQKYQGCKKIYTICTLTMSLLS